MASQHMAVESQPAGRAEERIRHRGQVDTSAGQSDKFFHTAGNRRTGGARGGGRTLRARPGAPTRPCARAPSPRATRHAAAAQGRKLPLLAL